MYNMIQISLVKHHSCVRVNQHVLKKKSGHRGKITTSRYLPGRTDKPGEDRADRMQLQHNTHP